MSVIWTPQGVYKRKGYASEADLESAILQVQTELFGPQRVYLDVKKKIGIRGSQQNIPDGYLIDLSSRSPRLYVVENELAAHDPLRHVAVQILQFALSFESEPRAVKTVLFNALQALPPTRLLFEQYATRYGYRNLDHLLDALVYDAPFAALVIIDDLPDNLENVLVWKFQFGVEVLELGRYEDAAGERMYQFAPFLADLAGDTVGVPTAVAGELAVDAAELDTIVVPAREDGFQATFLGENRWYAIRIHSSMRPQIKYIAVYRVAPQSAITHIGTVASIEPWKDSGKYVVNLVAPATPIGPVPLLKGGRVKGPQNLRYTSRVRLAEAQSLDDLW